MRHPHRFLIGLVALAPLVGCSGNDVTPSETVNTVARPLNPPPVVGAYDSGVYRNLFVEAGVATEAQVDAKIEALWGHYFTLGGSNSFYYAGDSNANGATAYVEDTGNRDVRSEGMSYAMMIAVQLGKKDEFKALWNWAKTYMQHNDGSVWEGYFAWHCDTRGRKKSDGPASDGEEYFAMALFFAEHLWGSEGGIYNYGDEANRILNTMLHKQDMNGGIQNGVTNMFDATEKQVVFVPYYSSATHTDPSYHLPAFYELWGRWAEGYNGQQAADRQFWLDAAATSRQFFHDTTNAATGLAPDYAEFDGTAKGDASGDRQGDHADFRFDAWRTAVNWSVDHAWWADDPGQITLSNTLQAFFFDEGIDSYGNQFELDGTPLSSDHSPGLVASNGAASLAADGPHGDVFVDRLYGLQGATGQYRYYDGMLHMLGMLHASGKFRIIQPDECHPLVTCNGSCVDVSSDDLNCGSCGNVCGAGVSCAAGECQIDCGGLALCSGQCVDTDTSDAHCGACDNACPPSSSCTTGICECSSGLDLCASGCVDLASDPDNCGSCDNVCATGMCTSGACEGGAGVFQMASGEVVMEAENFAFQETHGGSALWTPGAEGDASGGQAVTLLPNANVTWSTGVEATSPRLDFEVNFTETGNFKFYVRGYGDTRDDDACWGGIDDERIRQAIAPSSSGGYKWGYRNITVNTTGVHTVRLWGFEDGMHVDKIVITKGAGPSGTGPAESPRQ